MSYPASGRVRQVAPVEPVNDRAPKEKVIVGELLDRQVNAKSDAAPNGYTIDGQKESHPGFYRKHQVLNNNQQVAIEMYNSASGLHQGDQPVSSGKVDCFV